MTVNIAEEMIFGVNWRAELTTENSLSYFVRSGDELYDITRIDTFVGKREDLKIYASRMKHRPDLENVGEYE